MGLYFERYAYPEQLFSDVPDEDLKVIAVIPCYNEPDVLTTLDSLNSCLPISTAEVIIIINESSEENPQVKANNSRTIEEINQWREQTRPWFNLLTYHLIMPPRHAGVGLARKVGMDEASRRFEYIGQKKGVIACFDADSTCATNYFQSLDKNFSQTNKVPVGSSIYYEHRLPDESETRTAIIQYELHLRYYVVALRNIGYPYAFQTVGSSMAVRSDSYQKIGGMNKKKAGEDFYFLHRLIPSGYFINITDTTIYPSPRISERVPFGTGRAMLNWHKNNQQLYETYNLQSFASLKSLLTGIDQLYSLVHDSSIPDSLNESVREFLKADNFVEVLTRIKRQSTSLEIFRKNFFNYLDGFKVLKYLHYSRDRFYGNRPVVEEAHKLATELWPTELTGKENAEDLLLLFRLKDKKLA